MKKKSKRGTPVTGRKSGFQRRPHWVLTGALLASTVATTGMAKVAIAQEAGQATTGNRQPHSQRPAQHFEIPAGPLSAALSAFESATGIKVNVRLMSLQGMQSLGVTGDYTPEEALKRLLGGASLHAWFPDAKTAVVDRRPAGKHGDASGLAKLDAVAVTGDGAPVKVTSPKYTEPARDIPQTINVVSKEVMQEQGVTSLRDVMRNVPGITINSGEGGSTPGDKFNIRGFSASSDIYVDGVRDVSGYSREAFNLEQVEVSKGPNSSIEGRGSTGGSINLVTKTPSLRAANFGTVTLGSAHQHRETVDINQPLAVFGAPSAAFRLNAELSDAGVAGDQVLNNKSWGIAPSLAIGLGTPTQLLTSYVRTGQNNIPGYGIENFNAVPTQDTRKFYGLRSLDFERVATDQLQLRLDHDFGHGIHLRNQSTRGHSDSDRIVTSAVPVVTVTNPDSARRSPKSHINDNDVLANQTNVTASFATGAIEHSLVTGVEITRENSMWGKHAITGTPPSISHLATPTVDADFHPALAATVTRKARATELGAYAFETMKLTDKVQLNGGLRWDRYTPVYVDSASKATGLTAAVSSAVSGRAAVVVKPVEAASFYASYGTSFDPSSANLSADALSASSSLPPEKSRTYEVGGKWDLFKQRLASTLAFFRTDKINARTSDPADPLATTILAGKQRVQGVETQLSGNVTSHWNVLAGYSYMESKILTSLNPAQVGIPLANVPKHSVTTWTTYDLTKDLTIGGGAQYLDQRLLRNSSPFVYVPSYHKYDAMASYRVNPAVDLQLNLYNLSNKLYYDSGRMWVPAAGRSMSVTTSVKL